MKIRATLYHNTPENAKKIGWSKWPEYCIGNPEHPFVLHYETYGYFYFMEAK